MDDELNIDPRETDYLDDIDMDQAINFYELKSQLAALGFDSHQMIGKLREMMTSEDHHQAIQVETGAASDQVFFELNFEKDAFGTYQLYCIDAVMNMPEPHDYRVWQYFEPDVTATLATEFLKLDRIHQPFRNPARPLDRETVSEITMNTENLSYLQKQLLNLGFGEQMNEALEKQIKAKTPEFTLSATNEYNKQNVDYTLHFKAGDQNEMYFFNKYDASLRDKDMQQTFYINKGSGITAKEAYNLMDGRAVHKDLENQQGEKYKAWVVLDKDNKTENGNHKLNTFSEGWNYKPERAIDKMAIVGIDEPGAKDKLMKSLEKGNRQQVEALRDGKPVKLFLEANPAEHRVNITNYKGEAQQLEHYKKPEAKKEQKTAQSQEDAPAKKQRRGAKMKV
jgi:hypothetical protein